MNANNTMSQVEINKAIIQRYFEAYNTKNEAIFDDIIAPDYIDHGQSAYMGSPGRGVAGAKNDLKYSLDKLDEFNYVVEAMIASERYPDLVGAYWKGSLTPKSTSGTQQTNKIINYRGVSIYRIQNEKMVETWHVVDGWPSGTSIDSQDTLSFSVLSGVRSINEVFPLERAAEAYDHMMNGKARFRAVLTTGN